MSIQEVDSRKRRGFDKAEPHQPESKIVRRSTQLKKEAWDGDKDPYPSYRRSHINVLILKWS